LNHRDTVRVAIVGAAGRMGRELCRATLQTGGIALAGGTVEPGAPQLGADLGELCGEGRAGVVATEAPPEGAEALIEFTTPEATIEHLSYGSPHVIGTTGLSEDQLAKVEKAAENVPVVLAPNMSVGVNLLREVVRDLAAKIMGVFDRIQPPETDPMLDFDERDLLDLAEEAGFAEIHLDYEAEISTAATYHGVTDWKTFVKSAGNPKIPTIEEATDEVLTLEEIARFTAHLRPLVENARRKSTSALAFLRAVKGNPA